MKVDPHRESCRRQHRVFAHYLAIQAWLRKLDCVVIDRVDLERYLGLQRLKAERVKWLKEDFKPWFPYQHEYISTGTTDSIHSMYLSRVPIKKYLGSGSMTTRERIATLGEGAPQTGKFAQKATDIPTEREMIAELAVLMAGLDKPRN